jgi:transcriptional regulator with XRE-family HTH domain
MSSRSGQGALRRDGDGDVGRALATLRKSKGLTGQELGSRVRMSQAKVSKIETGAVIPSAHDIKLLGQALGATAAQIEQLVRQADAAREPEAGHPDLAPTDWQHNIAELEAAATELRMFSPAVLSGLLQTSEFARAVLTAVRGIQADDSDDPSGEVRVALSARVERQVVLGDQAKRFHFVIAETLLRNLVCAPDDMAGQMHRLLEVAQQDNVDMRIVAEAQRWPYPPFHGFSLFDEKHVVVDLHHRIIVVDDPKEVQKYRRIFDRIEAETTADVKPILDRYRRHYHELASRTPS